MNLPNSKIWPVEGVLILEYILGYILKHFFVYLSTCSWLPESLPLLVPSVVYHNFLYLFQN